MKILKNLAITDKTRLSVQKFNLPALFKEQWTVGIVFLSNKEIGKLNKKYLKSNRPTDVIAFNYSQNNCDLAISLEMAKENAEIYKTPFKKELMLYVIHGLLHVFGYNDDTLKNKKRMFKKQEEMLKLVAYMTN